MAAKQSLIPLLLPQDELLCSICRELINNPVTIPCGHNFCLVCIKTHFSKPCSSNCPHCRRRFSTKPDLTSNTILCSIMEHVEKVWPSPEIMFTPHEKPITCDVCEEGRELPAVKTCVTCLASFCSVHVTLHTTSQALAKHCLCTPVEDATELLCKKHGKLLELYCMIHRTAICWQCTTKHRNCNTRTVEEMRTDWKAVIKPVEIAVQDREDATDEALETLEMMSDGITDAAEKMKADIHLCFKTLINTIECAQQKALGFIETEELKAHQQIDEQKMRLHNHKLSISLIKDKITECLSNESYFNYSLPLPQIPPEVSQLDYIQMDGYAVEKMILDIQHLNSSLESQFSTLLERTDNHQERDLELGDYRVFSGHSKRRCNLLKYCCGVTFDPVTASASVLFSEDGLVATVDHSGLLGWKDYLVNPDMGFRVLCSQEFSRGQHYWEIKPPEDMDSNWAVGVAYKTIQERYQTLGQDKTSWCVKWQNKGKYQDKNEMCSGLEETTAGKTKQTQTKKGVHTSAMKADKPAVEEDTNQSKTSTGFFASHNQEMQLISEKPPVKIGVLLDCDQGRLSFFSVSDTKVRLCHMFQALFSAPVYPAVWLRDPAKTMAISRRLFNAE